MLVFVLLVSFVLLVEVDSVVAVDEPVSTVSLTSLVSPESTSSSSSSYCPQCRKHHPSRRSCFHLLRRGLLKRLVEQVSDLVEQVACILDALVLFPESED